MLKEFLNRLRTEEMPLLGPNMWLITTIGLRLPKSKFKRILSFIFHEIITLFVITQYIELFFVTDDLDTMINNIKSSSLSIICVMKSNTMLFWQDKWQNAFDYVTEADKFERKSGNPVREKIVANYTKQCSFVTYYYYILLFFTNFGVISLNLIVNMPSDEFRGALQNGTVPFPHIFSAWTPYDKNKDPYTWLTVAFQAWICSIGAIIISGYDTTAIVLMIFFGAKFELLRLRCAELFEGEPVSEEEFDERVRQLHSLHTQLIKNIRLVNSLLSPVMCLYVVLCSLVFCTSAFQLTFSTSISQRLMLGEYLGFGVTQLFMYCWISNDVLEKSSKLLLGPYESAWWAGSPRQRRSVLMLAGQMEKAYVFSAGPFTILTLPTFIAIVKGAYSYYTLLRN
uniref:Odorant receptor n=1 Tax=Ctenopseustis herana TaxID=65029 RepID=A0A097ITV4_9NEOP|nr:olfactory receptor 47 [Ctenopseustis herana]